MNRSQRILRCVADRPFPSMFDHVYQAVREAEPVDKRKAGTLRAAVSAQLTQLVQAKKLRRTGTPGAYLYHPTKLTFTDLRSFDAEGNPKTKSAARRKKATPAKPPAKRVQKPTPVKTAAPARLVATPVPAKRPGVRPIASTFPIAPTARPAKTQHESVEAFLARGGAIEQLPNGAVSRPLRSVTTPELHAWAKKTPKATT